MPTDPPSSGPQPGERLTAGDITALFTGSDGAFLCARWGRPVAPVAFGLAEESLAVFRSAVAAVFAHARHPLADTDPEMGANLMIFAVREWQDLGGIPDLDRLTGMPGLPERLAAQDADHYRLFRFDAATTGGAAGAPPSAPAGGIRACLTFLRLGGALADVHPARLGENVAVNAILTFARRVTPSAPLAALIRAAYDPLLPVCGRDPSHALRLAARL